MNLEELGWSETFAAALPEGLTPARVLMQLGPVSFLHDGAGEWSAMVSGKLRHAAAAAADLPVVGDWVAARAPEHPGERGAIELVLPRRTCFLRRAAGEIDAAQALAANIDTIFVVMGLDADFNLRRLERYLALAHASGAAPAVVLSKADLASDPAARVAQAQAVAPGAPVIAAALLDSVPDEVRARVGPGQTVALLGSSGAGKSTLINRLLGRDAQKTAAVRRGDGRGRHTTTHRQLFFVPEGGMVIDSPGLREVQLWEPDLEAAFDDIEKLAASCRFRDCRHDTEPGCAVRAGVAPERLASWHKLSGEMRSHREDRALHQRAKDKSE